MVIAAIPRLYRQALSEGGGRRRMSGLPEARSHHGVYGRLVTDGETQFWGKDGVIGRTGPRLQGRNFDISGVGGSKKLLQSAGVNYLLLAKGVEGCDLVIHRTSRT